MHRSCPIIAYCCWGFLIRSNSWRFWSKKDWSLRFNGSKGSFLLVVLYKRTGESTRRSVKLMVSRGVCSSWATCIVASAVVDSVSDTRSGTTPVLPSLDYDDSTVWEWNMNSSENSSHWLISMMFWPVSFWIDSIKYYSSLGTSCAFSTSSIAPMIAPPSKVRSERQVSSPRAISARLSLTSNVKSRSYSLTNGVGVSYLGAAIKLCLCIAYSGWGLDMVWYAEVVGIFLDISDFEDERSVKMDVGRKLNDVLKFIDG